MTPDNEQEHTAMNIVYQLGDLYELPVELRQRTNDQAIEFVKALIHSSYEQGRRDELEALLTELPDTPMGGNVVKINEAKPTIRKRLAELTQAGKENTNAE